MGHFSTLKNSWNYFKIGCQLMGFSIFFPLIYPRCFLLKFLKRFQDSQRVSCTKQTFCQNCQTFKENFVEIVKILKKKKKF